MPQQRAHFSRRGHCREHTCAHRKGTEKGAAGGGPCLTGGLERGERTSEEQRAGAASREDSAQDAALRPGSVCKSRGGCFISIRMLMSFSEGDFSLGRGSELKAELCSPGAQGAMR